MLLQRVSVFLARLEVVGQLMFVARLEVVGQEMCLARMEEVVGQVMSLARFEVASQEIDGSPGQPVPAATAMYCQNLRPVCHVVMMGFNQFPNE